jgi:aryl-alcohol dehydrogenase-like predicted oxidoreductase
MQSMTTEQGSTGRRSRIVFGTFDFPDTSASPALLDRFYAGGGRAIDLANVYLDGEAQQAVGQWLQSRGRPDGIVLYAKGCHPPFCAPADVPTEIERIRRAVDVEQIDVFLLHRDDLAFPVAAFADAMLAEVAAGRIGAFGVSNWTIPRTRELGAYVDRTDAGRLVAFSNHFSLAEMVVAPWPGCLASTRDELAELDELGLRTLAWSSLATGYFAGRDAPSWSSEENESRRERARELAGRLGTSPTAVALAYVLAQPEHVLPVVGTRSPEHLDEALGAADIELAPDELEWLETGSVSALEPD